jgi:hypothetical protein
MSGVRHNPKRSAARGRIGTSIQQPFDTDDADEADQHGSEEDRSVLDLSAQTRVIRVIRVEWLLTMGARGHLHSALGAGSASSRG